MIKTKKYQFTNYVNYDIIIKKSEKRLKDMIIPVRIQLRRKSFLPVIQIIGSSTVREAEGIVIDKILETIEDASKYKGLPTCTSNPKAEPLNNSKVLITTEIIFPSEKDLKDFEKSLKP